MRDLKALCASRTGLQLLLMASAVAVGCSPDGNASQGSAAVQVGVGGQAAPLPGSAGALSPGPAAGGPMPGLGVMTIPDGKGPMAGTGAAGTSPPLMTGAAGSAATGGSGAGAAAPGAAGMVGAAGSTGSAGSTGAAGAGAPPDGMDPTVVCMGGKVGMDSDSSNPPPVSGSRNLANVFYLAPAPTKIVNFKTTLIVPKTPTQKSTLFIWPGLQHRGGADPGRVGNGVLQPVLTWGPSCSAKAPTSAASYAGWWIAAMYVNVSTSAAGPGGCASGSSMEPKIGDRLLIEFNENGTKWTQTVTNLGNMQKVDLTSDLKGQDQNWAIWDIEIPGSSRPAEDTIFEKSVLTFSAPVTSCQPTNASAPEYYSAPVLSTDGLHCCYDKIILKQKRN